MLLEKKHALQAFCVLCMHVCVCVSVGGGGGGVNPNTKALYAELYNAMSTCSGQSLHLYMADFWKTPSNSRLSFCQTTAGFLSCQETNSGAGWRGSTADQLQVLQNESGELNPMKRWHWSAWSQVTGVEKQIVASTMLNYSEALLFSPVQTSCLVQEQLIVSDFVCFRRPCAVISLASDLSQWLPIGNF